MSYNFGSFLRDCVESVLQQEGKHNFEVIIVDDASTDGTGAYLDSIADPRVRIVRHSRNTGHVTTANDGIAAARGDLIARIDGDDRYKPWFLNEAIPIFGRFPEVGSVYGDVARIDATGAVVEDPWRGIRSREVHGGADHMGDEFIALIRENFLPAPTLIARRAAWEEATPIPAGFAFSDWYLNLRIARRNATYYRARTLAEYRIHGGNLHRNIPRDRAYERTVLAVLDQIFAENDHQQEKAEVKRELYHLAYRNLAERYASWGAQDEARRCYRRAIRWAPTALDGMHDAGGLLNSLLAPVRSGVKRVIRGGRQ